jgi:hypothetical protein
MILQIEFVLGLKARCTARAITAFAAPQIVDTAPDSTGNCGKKRVTVGKKA